MYDAIPCPALLDSQKLKQLNALLVERTGCFAFLKTDQVLLSTRPASWQDAYTIYVAGLYAVYHDFGCKFLKILISEDFCPQTMPIDAPSARSVDSHIKGVYRHRAGIAHGIIHELERIKLQKNLARYYLSDLSLSAKAEVWPDFINSLNEERWKSITAKLINDADKVYFYLEQWSEAWANDAEALPALKQRFAGHEDFANSFDDRICRPILVQNGVGRDDVYKYTNRNAQDIQHWRSELVRSFLSGEEPAPDGLYRKLEQLIRNTVAPPAESSDKRAEKYGFGIPW